MILIFDTYYYENEANTVCISFKDWNNEVDFKIYSETISNLNEYISGEFYRRELPCILSLINKINLKDVKLIIIDGYVFLDDQNKAGLGAYLYTELKNEIPIVGVAKKDFVKIEKNKRKLFRGNSKNPLFITSIGINLDFITTKIKEMKGNNRIPTLLKKVDTLTKENKKNVC